MREKEKKMSNNIVKKESNAPTAIMQMMVEKGIDPSDLKELLEIQKDWERNEARKAYHKAMAQFKSEPIEIEKDRKVGYSTSKGRVGYSHASLSNVVKKITAGLSKYGLSASWRTQQNGLIIVTCRITHEQGHYEETSLSAQADDTGSKNSIQAIGSTISYLERYTILSLTGLATTDMDDDGRGGIEKIDENKVNIINNLIKETKTDEKKFLEYMGVETIKDINAPDYAKAKMALESKRGKA